jgi:hypothetical protein
VVSGFDAELTEPVQPTNANPGFAVAERFTIVPEG